MFLHRDKSTRGPSPAARVSTRGGTILEFVVLGGLLAGALGIFEATQMAHPWDVALCLFGSLSGCGLICCPYFSRD
jgi:hypothetical protein